MSDRTYNGWTNRFLCTDEINWAELAEHFEESNEAEEA